MVRTYTRMGSLLRETWKIFGRVMTTNGSAQATEYKGHKWIYVYGVARLPARFWEYKLLTDWEYKALDDKEKESYRLITVGDLGVLRIAGL